MRETACADGLDNDADTAVDCADTDCEGLTCRAAPGVCDVAEVCTGGACPMNRMADAGTECRPATDGGCDVAEACDGRNTGCPTDAFAPNTQVCRPAGSVCDVAESCSGGAPTCPPDRFVLVGTPCGATCMQICDNAGTCGGSGGACPNGFGCGTGMCLTSCTSPAQCQPNFTCAMNQCVRVPESNCLDGVDNNGDGLADCQDPTCLGSQVQCVPSVGAGASLGIMLGSGPCPAGYTSLLNRFQGLQGQPCVGCTCATACSVTVYAYSTASCGGSSASFTFTNTSTSYVCQSVTPTNRLGTTRSAFGRVCQPGGFASQGTPTWATTDAFCVAQTSQTCASGSVCAPVPPVAEPVCVDIDGTASCPSGYTSTMSNYFTGFTAGSCGSCSSCTVGPSLSCNGLSTVGLNCSGGAATLADNSCGTVDGSRNPVGGIANQFIRSGTDNCSITPVNNPPTATGARRLCCRP